MFYSFFGILLFFAFTGREHADAPRVAGVADRIVKQLSEPYFGTHRIITYDNFFTNYDVAQYLQQNKIYSVGTLRKNKRCIPKEFLPNKKRPESSNIFGFRPNMTLVSHVPKKNKAVLLLSTFHHGNSSEIHSVDENGKSEINLFYNKTKGGVDTLDQLCHTYSCQRKTNRWPNAYFMNMVNVGAVAAYVVFSHLHQIPETSKRKDARKKFLNDLADQLTFNCIKNRSHQGLTSFDKSSIKQVLRATMSAKRTDQPPPVKRIKRRCYKCPSNIHRKMKQICQVCHENVCNEHAVTTVKCISCHAAINLSDSE